MEKKLGTMKFTKTDDGLRIDISGDDFKEMCSCCCEPPTDKSSDCCPPKDSASDKEEK